jgi:hypothetical protein
MVGRVLIPALMWTVIVEMALVSAEHGPGMALVIDQHPVGALSPDAADKPFRITVLARGVCGGVLMTSTFSAANTASNDRRTWRPGHRPQTGRP